MIDNLYLHTDGGYYCLLIPEAAYKNNDEEGAWEPGVVYIGPDGGIRTTTRARWDDRFTQVKVDNAAVAAMPEDVQSMIRRANPGDHELDFVRVFESWQESEINLTGTMLELAVAAVLVKAHPEAVRLESTIKSEDLQQLVQNYEIDKVAEPHGFTFIVRKSFPENA